ncbi:MAG: ABC transporter ATP-binding protein [Lachnospiraceae bacterium]|nr:ABC transporter ATP-binding protein [Lachnospiraceae bacterium]
MIELINITKQYGEGPGKTEALRGINLSIEKGSFIAIMGPSGSGKSTLLNILGGMTAPSTGQYLFMNEDVGKMSGHELEVFRRKHIAFVFQNFALMNRYTVFENVEMPLLARKIKNRTELVNHCLEEVGMLSLSGKNVNEISGGERQRTAIARALAMDTDVLLADEPTGALDRNTGNEIMSLFEKIHKNGKTVILITHDEQVAACAERIVRIENGLQVN